MAGIQFSPGEIGTKSLFKPFGYQYVQKSNPVGDKSVPSYGPVNYAEQMIKRTVRPAYPKGNVITLPGGTVFRKSTAYNMQTWSLERTSKQYEGHYWNFTNLQWTYRGARDSGREVGYLISTDQSVIGTSIPRDARNEAVTKALNKIADQKVNLGENLATLGQTVRLFTGKVDILREALQYARKHKSWQKLLNKSLRDISRKGPLNITAQEYLAYVYGLKPLMGDVWTLAELMKTQAQQTLLLKGVGSASRMQSHGPKSIGAFSYSQMKRLAATSQTRVKCTVWARLDPNGATLRSMSQLGLVNPFGLAWDLVPYSFVVDWFLPIGPVLYAMSAPAGLLFVDGSVAMRNSEISEFEYKARTTSYNYASSLNDEGKEEAMVVQTSYDGYVRETLSTWPIPGLWFDQDPFRADRPLKALALSVLELNKRT